ncbi:YggS family pyridoxal phosphate-dependent enzyme [Eubacterium coprostanoligenes]|uniref:Pyridoxal phosphate homeostasis protein n=1 Tax=Eubacterium coprostanoligenes TaxID=290054 RepID=A0A1T4K2K8_9FIRM|nr:YggS family pyridoxal phosphate-dependent enzyme [Eubacterium coprostanoligenes]MCI6254379.1 YggS family pyridoxal phosphate-dependent enzyme [Eubacterium coprostanoligenes]MCI6361605.1 YggS family pyridoxal phosphate-dependent enzyme [Eubacterium coprostanoligenes]MDD7358726.1 YggS family pyridoxal phosphate-dependent enzyme [Eubacterium coprostanoligenes]MDY4698580.1 YggS family pyridoxal phosphate-dependent enzyme [Eubacterium coprostanoligenes]MDY5400546.1 YggS family pyridoxal phosphat
MEKFILDEERVKSCIDNYKRIKNDVMETAVKAGRSENDVRLMCVTKTVEPEYINPVLDLGADLIGENRVQEYCSKLDTLHLDGVEKHIIGHLQTNKVKYIAGKVDMIESVDSIKLAKEINKEFKKADAIANVLVEVNIGKEESKSGCNIEELEELLCQIAEFDNIKIKGLMTIPPICDEAEARKYFAKMHDKFVELQEKSISGVDMQILSMGMSADYEAAILEGSNIVRVGSAIFGARKYF